MYNSVTVEEVELTQKEVEFYSKDFDPNKKRIFLLGSSHMLGLNTTFIENYLFENNLDYEVYNLIKGSDKPKIRLATIDMIISAQPEIIVYGIAERDFKQNRGGVSISTSGKPESFLPDPTLWFDEVYWQLGTLVNVDYDFLQNPKLTSLMTIHKISEDILDKKNGDIRQENVEEKFPPYPRTPFYEIDKSLTVIKSEEELEEMLPTVLAFHDIRPPYKNANVISLKTIIDKLQENNIKVVVFSTPHHPLYLNAMPDSVNSQFETVLENVALESNLKIHQFYDRYGDLKVWRDPTHIAINPNATVFSEDIAKIIVKDLEK